MRHAALVTSIVLTLMSAFALGQVFTLGQPSSALLPAPANQQVEETAMVFYDAVNDYLGGGDDAALRKLLHPAFVTRQSGSTWTGTADDFLGHLDSTRRLYPGIQLELKMVSINSDTASVTLSVIEAEIKEFAGIGIDPADLFGQLEFVRIERGLVIERWSSAPLAGQLDAYPALSIDLPFTIHTLLARVQEIPLERVFEPMVSPFRHLVVIVKSGEARLDVMSQPATPAMIWRANRGPVTGAIPVEPEMTITLEPVDAVYLPAGMQFRMWDSSNVRTVLIALDFGPPTSGAVVATESLAASLDGTLSSGIALEGVGDLLTLSFGSATLLPNSTLSSQETDGMCLAWVTSGSLDMAGWGGELRVRKVDGHRAQLIDGHSLLLAGETAAAGPGADIRYQVAGNAPASAWFFSIVPAPVPASPNEADADPASPTPVPTPAPPPNRTLS